MSAAVATALWVLAAVVVAATGVWAWSTAQRLNRLHIRLDRSRDALQAALDRRCAVIAATVPELADQARAVEEVRLTPTDLATRLELEGGLQGGVDKQKAPALREADTRVALALHFYNDAVADTRALQLRPAVRTLRLGGTAALPSYADMGQLR